MEKHKCDHFKELRIDLLNIAKAIQEQTKILQKIQKDIQIIRQGGLE